MISQPDKYSNDSRSNDVVIITQQRNEGRIWGDRADRPASSIAFPLPPSFLQYTVVLKFSSTIDILASSLAHLNDLHEGRNKTSGIARIRNDGISDRLFGLFYMLAAVRPDRQKCGHNPFAPCPSCEGLINIHGFDHSLFFVLITPILITFKPVWIIPLLPKVIRQPGDWRLSIQ
jgi:hypothetical protein